MGPGGGGMEGKKVRVVSLPQLFILALFTSAVLLHTWPEAGQLARSPIVIS